MRKPCCDKVDRNKGAWSKQEDQKLIDYIKAHGEGCWRSLPEAAGLLRCGKSCRLRWINYLRPDLKRGNFSEDEEDLIIKLHALLGNRWSLIAGRLPGRTDNEVKNYWNSHLRRKLINMGIDPSNHRLNQRRELVPSHDQQQQNGNSNVSTARSSTSSGSKSQICHEEPHDDQQQPVKLSQNDQDHDSSDAASCLKDDDDDAAYCGALPDLNLDLTLSTTSSSPPPPPPPLTPAVLSDQMIMKQYDHEPKLASSPALRLFM